MCFHHANVHNNNKIIVLVLCRSAWLKVHT